MGVGEGLGKPIFVVALNKRINAFAISKFSIATVSLNESSALAFQLDLFLSTPHETIFVRGQQKIALPNPIVPKIERGGGPVSTGYALERQVYEIIIEAGGSAIAEPENTRSASPDLLMWLPQQESSLLDPAAIEVKAVGTTQIARKVEKQLLSFMQVGGIQSAILLTHDQATLSFRPTVPNFFWLSIENFELLIRSGNLGQHLRNLRNRAAHGAP
jgi:hypothetical protein